MTHDETTGSPDDTATPQVAARMPLKAELVRLLRDGQLAVTLLDVDRAGRLREVLAHEDGTLELLIETVAPDEPWPGEGSTATTGRRRARRARSGPPVARPGRTRDAGGPA